MIKIENAFMYLSIHNSSCRVITTSIHHTEKVKDCYPKHSQDYSLEIATHCLTATPPPVQAKLRPHKQCDNHLDVPGDIKLVSPSEDNVHFASILRGGAL